MPRQGRPFIWASTPIIKQQMQKKSALLVLTQSMSEKLADVQGINFPVSLHSLLDDNIAQSAMWFKIHET